MGLKAFEWKDRSSLIEKAFPAGKISVESYKEQMAGHGKTLTPLGSYWKGRKPLVLAKACVLGALLPSTGDDEKDLAIFDMLMGMDENAMRLRLAGKLPKGRIGEAEKMVRKLPFREQVTAGFRTEEMDADILYSGIWDKVNAYLGTEASSMQELVEEIGIARFGCRPKVADVFCGSGQIPFEAARLGCDVYASDLNPVACLLTWGAFNIIGIDEDRRKAIAQEQKCVAEQVQQEIDALGIETDEAGWRGRAYLYCVETRCPQSGWLVPMLTTCIVSKPRSGTRNCNVCIELVSDAVHKRYDIKVVENIADADLPKYASGTVQNGYLVHSVNGICYRTDIKNIRGDYKDKGKTHNRLRIWEKTDFIPRKDDIFQERLYCIQWMRQNNDGHIEYSFRSVSEDDLKREQKVIDYVGEHLAEWQKKGFIPDMVIEKGDETERHETERLYRERGWTHWHHLFNPRQLLLCAFVGMRLTASIALGLFQMLNFNSRLSIWNPASGKGDVINVFYNQALNTLFNYGCRGSRYALRQLFINGCATMPMHADIEIRNSEASKVGVDNDIYITDPPYGDAVNYEEITEFFIAWLRKNPPKPFADWTWDSRRTLAIKGEDEIFRQKMIAAYSAMREHMPDNGLQILMFTHKSSAIWSDMASIIWASGLQVKAAWCVATETESALRQGSNVKSTVILVLRKRLGRKEAYSVELGYDIEKAVKEQIERMSWLNEKRTKKHIKSKPSNVDSQIIEPVYSDADLQMAGYAAALSVLTSYAVIDGRDMIAESREQRSGANKDDTVKQFIEHAEQMAIMHLVPDGIAADDWNKLTSNERFYLKMAELEGNGEKLLDTFQRFGKALKAGNFEDLMAHGSKANSARLALGLEMKNDMMSGRAGMAGTPLRALLHAVYSYEEVKKKRQDEQHGLAPIDVVLQGLQENCPDFYRNRRLLVSLGRFLAAKRAKAARKRESYAVEAANLRIIAEALENQKME